MAGALCQTCGVTPLAKFIVDGFERKPHSFLKAQYSPGAVRKFRLTGTAGAMRTAIMVPARRKIYVVLAGCVLKIRGEPHLNLRNVDNPESKPRELVGTGVRNVRR